MVDNRNSFQLDAPGVVAVGVLDRYNAAFAGSLTNMTAVVGTAPAGGPLTFELRREGTVVGTGTIADGETEVSVDLVEDLSNPTADPSDPNPQPTPPQYPTQNPLLRFGDGTTFDLNVTAVGTTTPGSDLNVTVAITAS